MPNHSPDNSPGRGPIMTRRSFLNFTWKTAAGVAAAASGLDRIDIARAQEILPTEPSFPLPEFPLDSNTELSTFLNGLLTDEEKTSATPLDVPLAIPVTVNPDTRAISFIGFDQSTPLGTRLGGLLGGVGPIVNAGTEVSVDFNARVENGIITQVAPYLHLNDDFQSSSGLHFLPDSALILDNEGETHYQIPIPGIEDRTRGRKSAIRPVRLQGAIYNDYRTMMQQRHPSYVPQEEGTLVMGQVVQEPGVPQGKLAVTIALQQPLSFIEGFRVFGSEVLETPTPEAPAVGTVSRALQPVVSQEDRTELQRLYPGAANINYDAPVVYAIERQTYTTNTWYAAVDHSGQSPVYGFVRSDEVPLNINGPVTPAIAERRGEYEMMLRSFPDFSRTTLDGQDAVIASRIPGLDIGDINSNNWLHHLREQYPNMPFDKPIRIELRPLSMFESDIDAEMRARGTSQRDDVAGRVGYAETGSSNLPWRVFEFNPQMAPDHDIREVFYHYVDINDPALNQVPPFGGGSTLLELAGNQIILIAQVARETDARIIRVDTSPYSRLLIQNGFIVPLSKIS